MPTSEPCIRGHRATTCNHANERVMIPVRKPGRPLSTCPHRTTERKTCGCHGITVAFPRRQKCPCVDSTTGERDDEVGSSTRSVSSISSRVAASPSPSLSSNRSCRSSISARGPPSGTGGSTTAEMINRLAMLSPPSMSTSLAAPDNEPTFQQLLYQQAPRADGLGRLDQGLKQPYDFLDDYDPIRRPSLPSNTPEYVDRHGRRTSISTTQDTSVSSAGSPMSTMSSYTADSQSSFTSHGGTDALSQYGFGEPGGALHGIRSTRSLDSRHYRPSITEEESAANGSLCSNCLSQVQPSQPTTPMPPPPPPPPPLAMHLIDPTQLRIGHGGALYVVLPQAALPVEHTYTIATNLSILPVPTQSGRGGPFVAHNCNCGPTCQCIGCLSHPFINATQEYVQSAFQHSFDGGGATPSTMGLDMDVADAVTSATMERESSLFFFFFF